MKEKRDKTKRSLTSGWLVRFCMNLYVFFLRYSPILPFLLWSLRTFPSFCPLHFRQFTDFIDRVISFHLFLRSTHERSTTSLLTWKLFFFFFSMLLLSSYDLFSFFVPYFSWLKLLSLSFSFFSDLVPFFHFFAITSTSLFSLLT